MLQDLRYAVRMLLRSPGFTAVAVLTLALGIGANTAIFSIANAVLFRPLPFPHSDRLVYLAESFLHGSGSPIAYANFLDWQRQAKSFEHMAVHRGTDFTVSGVDGAERIQGEQISAEFFTTLGVRALRGRDFLPSDDRQGAAPVALIGYGLWQRRFGGDPSIVGKTIPLGDHTRTIVGVLPPGRYPTYRPAEIYVPLGSVVRPREFTQRDIHVSLYGIARMRRGITLQQADAEMQAVAAALARAYPDTNTGHGVNVWSLQRTMTLDQRTPLLILLATVGFLLLISCANISNLLLARNAARSRELAIRGALGARRWDIIRQLITESTLLALLGGGLGVLGGIWAKDSILKLVPDLETAFFRPVRLDLQVLAFTLLISVLAGIIAGILPALHHSSPNLNDALKAASNVGGAVRGRTVRATLIAAEVGLAFVLLVGAGLMLRTLAYLFRADPGFDPRHILTAEFPGLPAQPREFLDAIRSLPGVEAVASSGGGNNYYFPEGRPVPQANDWSMARTHSPFGDYLQVFRIPLRQGRWFASHETEQSGVAVVNETMARRVWPGEDAIGKRFKMGRPGADGLLATVVGVVGDVHDSGFDQPVEPTFYIPSAQVWDLAIRTSGDPTTLVPALRARVQAMDRRIALYGFETMEDRLKGSFLIQRDVAFLLTVFAALALVLAAVGIYGVIAHAVSQRTHEIGVRLALGARPAEVASLMLRQGMLPVAVGTAAGLAGALASTHALSSLLFGVQATDTLTFVSGALILAVVALLAIYLPARRAARVDPMVALRYE